MESDKRETWTSKADFVLTCIGWCVGLGNVWRFPYLCYSNGGGAFLIPYVITLVLCAFPVLCLEFLIGQYAGLGTVSLWNSCPFMKGVSYTALLYNTILVTYYMLVIAISFWYFIVSLLNTLPWSDCKNEWNTPMCYAYDHKALHLNYSSGEFNTSTMKVHGRKVSGFHEFSSPAEEYFRYGVLNISDGIESIGVINWNLFWCLLVVWLVVPLANIKGIKSSGKVVYFTATFPYIILTLLVVRGCTLKGSLQGIKFYLVPKWEKLLDCQVWLNAAMQVFFSLGCGQGVLPTLASFNKFKNKCIRDACMMAAVNACTSLYAGIAIFSTLGYMASNMAVQVSEVLTSGPGLAFIAYPQALATMPLAPLWSACFFFMLILLGVDTEMANMEFIITCLRDECHVLKGNKARFFLTASLTALCLGLGLIFVTEGGFYIFTLVDWYASAFALLIGALSECIAFSWLFGLRNLSECYHVMLGQRLSWYFRICWSVISPALIVLILVFNIILWNPVTLGSYEYPVAARIAGWLLVCVTLMPIPAVAVYKFIASSGTTVSQKLRNSIKPSMSFQRHVAERTKQAHKIMTCNTERECLNNDTEMTVV